MIPVIVGLVVIWIVFYAPERRFLSSRNLVELSLDSATIGMISVGHRARPAARRDRPLGRIGVGRRASILAVLLVYHGWPLLSAILAALCVGVADRRRSTACSSPGSVCRASSSRWPGLLAFLGVQL